MCLGLRLAVEAIGKCCVAILETLNIPGLNHPVKELDSLTRRFLQHLVGRWLIEAVLPRPSRAGKPLKDLLDEDTRCPPNDTGVEQCKRRGKDLSTNKWLPRSYHGAAAMRYLPNQRGWYSASRSWRGRGGVLHPVIFEVASASIGAKHTETNVAMEKKTACRHWPWPSFRQGCRDWPPHR